MTIYGEELCIVYNKKFSSFALYDERDGDGEDLARRVKVRKKSGNGTSETKRNEQSKPLT